MPETKEGIYTTGGTVQASGGMYISRSVDQALLDLCRQLQLTYILAPRQSGKSSLMVNTVRCLASEGIRSAVVDLEQMGTELDADQWYYGIADDVHVQLGLTTSLADWWDSHASLGLAQRLFRFFEQVVLAEVEEKLVVFIDEIDTTLSLNFTDDFYALIRALLLARATTPILERLSFVLIGVATPGELIRDPKRTPFNIGIQLEMPDFTLQEAMPLADGLGLSMPEAQEVLSWIVKWTGGHPYLTQVLCQAVASDKQRDWTESALKQLVYGTFLAGRGSENSNIQFVRDMLTKRASDRVAVLTTYRTIRRGFRRVPDEEHSVVKSYLKLSGVVRRDGSVLVVRNEIYKAVFDEGWIREHFPRLGFRTLLADNRVRFGAAYLVTVTVLLLLMSNFAVSADQARSDAVEAAQTSEARGNEALAAATSAAQAHATADSIGYSTLAKARADYAMSQLSTDPELGLILAIAAVKATSDQHEQVIPEAEEALHEALRQSDIRERWFAGHDGDITSAAWSPDGKSILTAGKDGVAKIRDSLTGKELAVFTGNAAEITSAAWSPDGKSIVTASSDGTARIWDATTGHLLFLLSGHTQLINIAAWSPDGRFVVTASEDGTARIWDSSDGSEKTVFRQHTASIYSAMWSPDGRFLVTAGDDQTARIWDVTGVELQVLRGHTGSIGSVQWSPDGKSIVTASKDGTARIWDASTGQQRLVLGPRNSSSNMPIWTAVWSPSGQRVATGGNDGKVSLWDAETGKELAALDGNSGAVGIVVWSPDGKSIATGSRDRAVRIWDTATWKELNVLHVTYFYSIHGVRWSPDGKLLLVTGSHVQIWDPFGGNELPSMRTDLGDGISSIEWSDSDTSLVVNASGQTEIWDPKSGTILAKPTGRFDSLSRDRRLLATSDSESDITELWDATNGHFVGRFPGATARWSGDGRYLLTVDMNGQTRIWDTVDDRLRTMLHGLVETSPVYGLVEWSPDGRYVAAIPPNDGSLIALWDTTTGALHSVLRGHQAAVVSLAWSPDSEKIISTSEDVYGKNGHQDEIILWDVQSAKILFSIPSSWSYYLARSVSWNPDGKSFLYFPCSGCNTEVRSPAAGAIEYYLDNNSYNCGWSTDEEQFACWGNSYNSSNEGSLQIRDTETGDVRQTLLASAPATGQPVWSPDGQWIAASTGDGAVTIWNSATGALRTQLRDDSKLSNPVWSSDGSILAAVDDSGTIRQYELDIQDLLRLATTRVTRGTSDIERARYLGEPLPTDTPTVTPAAPTATATVDMAAKTLAEGISLARQGQIMAALQDYRDVEKANPDVITAASWNKLCWYGSIWEHVNDVAFACDRAITLDPSTPNYQDSRGLVRALRGDYNGAIADFEVYYTWLNTKQNGSPLYRLRSTHREAWIQELKAGRNPFTPAVLESLRADPDEQDLKAQSAPTNPPECSDQYEPDGTADKAQLIFLYQAQTHRMCPSGDTDWVRFYAHEGSSYIVQAESISSDLALDMYVVDDTTAVVAERENLKEATRSLEFRAQHNGLYYIEVKDGGSSSKNLDVLTYQIAVSLGGPNQVTPTVGGSVTPTRTRDGSALDESDFLLDARPTK